MLLKNEQKLKINNMFFGPSTDLRPAEFKQELDKTNGVVIDCRTPGECAGGTWPGATCIDWLGGEMQRAVSTLDPNQSYFLYCRSGNRSAQATRFLKAKGFEKVYNVGAIDSIIHEAQSA